MSIHSAGYGQFSVIDRCSQFIASSLGWLRFDAVNCVLDIVDPKACFAAQDVVLFRRLFGRWFRRLFGAADGQISRIDRSFRWIAGGVVVRPPALRLSDDSAMKDGDTRRACLSACFT